MVTKILGDAGTYRAVNTDYDESGPSLPVTIVQQPEETGDRIWVLDAIQYSYKGSSIAGGLEVKLDDKVKLSLDINNSVGSIALYLPSQTDKVISVTLLGGGNGVIGKLNCQWHLEPAI